MLTPSPIVNHPLSSLLSTLSSLLAPRSCNPATPLDSLNEDGPPDAQSPTNDAITNSSKTQLLSAAVHACLGRDDRCERPSQSGRGWAAERVRRRLSIKHILTERQSADDVGFFRSMTSKLCAVYYLLFTVLAIWPVSASAGEASGLMRITTSLSSLLQPSDAFRQPQGRRPTRRTHHHEGRKYQEQPNSIFV